MPNGSLVAGASLRNLPNGKQQREVIFWEKNGLRHGEFVLPDKDGLIIKNLDFSLDSSLLAVHAINPTT